jgi:hypothetical protein
VFITNYETCVARALLLVSRKKDDCDIQVVIKGKLISFRGPNLAENFNIIFEFPLGFKHPNQTMQVYYKTIVYSICGDYAARKNA